MVLSSHQQGLWTFAMSVEPLIGKRCWVASTTPLRTIGWSLVTRDRGRYADWLHQAITALGWPPSPFPPSPYSRDVKPRYTPWEQALGAMR